MKGKMALWFKHHQIAFRLAVLKLLLAYAPIRTNWYSNSVHFANQTNNFMCVFFYNNFVTNYFIKIELQLLKIYARIKLPRNYGNFLINLDYAFKLYGF